jgi:DNA-binding transcriptional LysR family regulator
MNFTLRELEAFLGVARLGNFTRAARSLNMSQPALTVRIRHLEDALGVRLLDRTTRSVALTRVGRELLPVVERVLGEIDAVAANAREFAGKRRGLVTVAALPSIASTVLPVTIAAFKTRHPGVTVRMRDAVAQRVIALVKSGEADFGIGSPTKRDPELRISHLMDDPVSVALPPGHPLERRERVRLEDLLASPLILMDREYSVRALIERAFESIGRSVVPAYEASYVPTALGLVKAGLGIAIVALSAAGEAAELVGLQARPIDHPMLVRRISLIERAGRSLSPAAQQFAGAVSETCRRTARGPFDYVSPTVSRKRRSVAM